MQAVTGPAGRSSNRHLPRTDAGPVGVTAEAGQRERIVAAAVRCFERWGIERTRMQDIAAEAGMLRPHLYRHFPSKEALIVEVVLREIRLISARLARGLRLRGPVHQAVLSGLLSVVEESRDDEYVKLLLRSDVMGTTARIVAQADSVVEALAECFRPVFEYAERHGALREGLDWAETGRWLTFQLFAYTALPELVGSPDEIRRQLETFVLPALLSS
ncbi:MAG TPA: helix-turn-helix domain-containing protein [Acidimicrobiia bacterium]|nr:helix-turn-helix domain-containing protein [Acidimicrobiia bacterium]